MKRVENNSAHYKVSFKHNQSKGMWKCCWTKPVSQAHRQDIWDGFEKLHELGEAVVAQLALAAEVMMVGGDELAKGHSAVRLVAEEIHHLLSKLLGALNFLRCTICCGTNIGVKFRRELFSS